MSLADLPDLDEARRLRPLKQKWEETDRLDEAESDRRAVERLDQAWALGVKARDRWICQICQRKVQGTIEFVAQRAEADHIFPKSTHAELRHELDNGVTECLRCHRKVQHDRSLIPAEILARADACYARVLGRPAPERS